MSTIIAATQSGWLRYAPSQVITYGIYTYTLPAQYDASDAVNPLIGSHGWDEEYRAYWLWNFAGLGLGTITSGTLDIILESADTTGLVAGQKLQIVNATSSYADLLARACNATSFGSMGSGSTAMQTGGYTINAINLMPTRTSITLNASAITAINSAIAGSAKFAIGGYLTSINVAAMQFALLHAPSLSSQLTLS